MNASKLTLRILLSGTISYFIPTIVSQMGYAGTQAQLYSAIPYACAFVVSLAGNYSSDHFREKPFHAAVAISCAGVFCIVQAVGVSPRASFAILVFVACGIWTALPTYLAFVTLVMRSPPEKRAVAIAIINSLGNFSSVYGSFLWPSPPYTMGWSVTSAVSGHAHLSNERCPTMLISSLSSSASSPRSSSSLSAGARAPSAPSTTSTKPDKSRSSCTSDNSCLTPKSRRTALRRPRIACRNTTVPSRRTVLLPGQNRESERVSEFRCSTTEKEFVVRSPHRLVLLPYSLPCLISCTREHRTLMADALMST